MGRRDSEREFTDFVAARSQNLLRLAWMLTGDARSAEDLLQASLAKAWPHWSRISDGQPDAYVKKIMSRTANSWRRRRWTGETPTATLPDERVPDPVGRADERDRIRRMLITLPPRQRAVVVLRYYEDLSEAEVSELLGISLGAVKSQAARGLQKLRAALQDGVMEST